MADRASIDTLIKFIIPYGDWSPKGRKAEDGRLSNKNQPKEIPTDSYSAHTEKRNWSDATLIVSHGKFNRISA